MSKRRTRSSTSTSRKNSRFFRTGSLGSWRENPDGTPHPRYTLLAEQFDYANYPYSCSTYTNDPNYFVYR